MRTTEIERLADWGASLRLADVPVRVREHAKNQVLSTLGAVHSGFASDLGPAIARAFRPRTGDSADAAVLMSAWSMVLDYDDVMLGGHTGHSSVLVPLAFAPAYGLTGERVLLAQIVANEIAARINMAVALGPARGQTATHLHLAGAAAARAVLENLSPSRFADSLAFALSYPARTLYPAFLGSDAKTLCAAWPIRWGLNAVDAVCAGLRANTGTLEAVLFGLSPSPQHAFLGGLGKRWHTETNSYKTQPGSAYLQAAAEAASAVAAGRPRLVHVYCPLLAVAMEAYSEPYLCGPNSPIASLTFSVRYAVACALLFGRFRPEHLRAQIRQNQEVWEMFEKIRVHHDCGLTIDALRAPVPIGAALMTACRRDRLRFLLTGGQHNKGERARVSLRDKLRIAGALCIAPAAPIPEDFSRFEKPLGARLVAEMEDGRIREHQVRIPRGFAGAGDWTVSRALMRNKLVDCARDNIGLDDARALAQSVERLELLGPAELRQLTDFGSSRHETVAPAASLSVRRGALEY